MTTKRPIVWMIVLCFACAPQAMAGMLIGASFDGTIYDVDPATGLATNPRESGLDTIVELAFSPDGDLFATNFVSVYRITPGGNPPELIGGEIPFGSWRGISFDPSTGVLYGAVDFAGIPELYTLDIEIGTPTLIGGGLSLWGAIAFDPQGRLYLQDFRPVLSEIDKLTSNVLNSVSISVDLGRAGMTFSEDGTLFIVDGDTAAATDTLYTLNTTTGVLTSIGHTGLDNGLVGLAYIPEPSTFALFALSALTVFGCTVLRRPKVAVLDQRRGQKGCQENNPDNFLDPTFGTTLFGPVVVWASNVFPQDSNHRKDKGNVI